MKKLFPILPLCFCAFMVQIQATQVIFPLVDFTGSANNRPITVIPDPATNDAPLIYGNNLVAAQAFTLNPAGGSATNNLLPWGYTIRVDGWSKTAHIVVPDSATPVNIITLITNAVAVGFPVVVDSAPVAPGFGLVNTTAGSTNTLSVDSSAILATSEFTIALLPDTQYAIQHPASWVATMQWLEAQKPLIAIGLGDVVDDSRQRWQWTNALAGYNLLTCPVVVGAGNHDVSPGNVYTNFNTYFPRSFYTNKPWFSGGFEAPGEQQNMYLLATNGSTRLLVISLAWAPDATQMQWASNVAAAYPTHRVILETHCYLMPDGHRSNYAAGDIYTPSGGTDGVAIWGAARNWANLSLIVCGHQVNGITDETNTLAIGAHGNWVQQIFCDHQDNPTAYFSAVKLLTFKPDGTVRARTWDQLNRTFMPKFDYSFQLGAGVPMSVPIAGSNVVFTALGDGQNYRVDVSLPPQAGVSHIALDKMLWLKFDDTNNLTTVADFSGWGRSVTGLVNSVAYGTSGRAMWGTTNTILVQDPDRQFRNLTNFSTSFWFRMTNEPSYPALFVSRFCTGDVGAWFVGLSGSGTVRFAMVNTNATARTNLDLTGLGSALYNGNWHYVCATFNGSNMTVSVDARYSVNGPWGGGISDYANGLFINGTMNSQFPNQSYAATTYPTGAFIDELKIWGRALTAEEVHADYESAGAELTPIGLKDLVLPTNYVAANFIPISGKVTLVASNNWLYAVSNTRTNPIVQIAP